MTPDHDDLHESARLRAVRAIRAEPDDDGGLLRLTALVAQLLGFPSAAITLVDEIVQRAVASFGPGIGELPRSASFCAVAIQDPDDLLVVPDAAADPRFDTNALVRDGLRAYVGAPLVTRDGHALGALCVFDDVPHQITEGQRAAIDALAGAVVLELERRRDLEVLAGVTRLLARADDLATIRDGLVAAVGDVCGAEDGFLLLRRGDGLAGVPGSDGGREPLLTPGDPSIGLRVLEAGGPVFVPDVQADPGLADGPAFRAGLRSVLGLPAHSGADARITAVLAAGWRTVREQPGAEAGRTLELLADEAAVAVERAALLDRLAADGRTDALTGAPNRRVLHETLEREVARARRHGDDLAVAMLDLDRFKAYNDAHGHPAGDRLLVAVAGAWLADVRVSDLVARYGGEEFAVVMPSSDAAGALTVVRRLLALVPEGQSASAGIAVRVSGEGPEELVARADRALYRAKGLGGATATVDET